MRDNPKQLAKKKFTMGLVSVGPGWFAPKALLQEGWGWDACWFFFTLLCVFFFFFPKMILRIL